MSALSRPVSRTTCTRRTLVIANNKITKINLSKQGLESVDNKVVRNNLKGTSDSMKDKNWKDASGRKGKGYNVYKFSDKYGANVDGYSPIYTPDVWSEGGSEYKLGSKGLIAWAGLLVVVLGVGISLVVSTSALNN